MAYLYGELEGKEKEMVEQYLLENAEARLELEKLKQLRHALSNVKDKEVIAPPIFVGDSRPSFIWNAPYFKTIVSIAASLLIIMLVGKFSGLQIGYTDNELRISFGKQIRTAGPVTITPVETLSSGEVQQMINATLQAKQYCDAGNMGGNAKEVGCIYCKEPGVKLGKNRQPRQGVISSVAATDQRFCCDHASGECPGS